MMENILHKNHSLHSTPCHPIALPHVPPRAAPLQKPPHPVQHCPMLRWK